ncbi:MAG TPA: YihY/virulence factor BrkB family protein [Gaiellaceae bacterium]|jgi:membrane protein|nr:YihY/virulence factor BrkB family protein [Gaiellaceae bacterium]
MRNRLRDRIESWTLGRAALGAAAGYTRHATSQLAAAISYRVLFSLVPLAAFIVAIADVLLPDELRNAVARWLVSVVPGRALDPSVEQALTGSRITPTVAAAISLAILLWAASAMMAAIRIAFRVIWENDRRRPYVQSKLLDFALVLGVGLLAVASLGATLLVQVLAEIGHDLSRAFGTDTLGAFLATAAEVLTSTGLTLGVLVVLYRTVPPVAPRLGAVWLPALLASIGFHVATAVYALYLARWGDVVALYGPLAAVLGFLLVVYVGVIVILLGAELVAAWPEPGKER